MACEPPADIAVSLLVMDGGDAHGGVLGIVAHRKQAEIAHQFRAEELQHEALGAIVRPSLPQYPHPVAASGDVRKPGPVFLRGLGANAPYVAHHGKSQRVGIDAAETPIFEGWLKDNGGMGVQELEHGAVGELAALVKS